MLNRVKLVVKSYKSSSVSQSKLTMVVTSWMKTCPWTTIKKNMEPILNSFRAWDPGSMAWRYLKSTNWSSCGRKNLIKRKRRRRETGRRPTLMKIRDQARLLRQEIKSYFMLSITQDNTNRERCGPDTMTLHWKRTSSPTSSSLQPRNSSSLPTTSVIFISENWSNSKLRI